MLKRSRQKDTTCNLQCLPEIQYSVFYFYGNYVYAVCINLVNFNNTSTLTTVSTVTQLGWNGLEIESIKRETVGSA